MNLLKPSLALFAIMNMPLATSWAACNIVGDKMYGDCSNVTLNVGTKGPIKVTGYREESGIISDATVMSGGHLDLNGVGEGTITVKKGGKLSVSGVANYVSNHGTVDIEGMVDHLHNQGTARIGGQVGILTGTGKVVYRNGAVVNGAPRVSK